MIVIQRLLSHCRQTIGNLEKITFNNIYLYILMILRSTELHSLNASLAHAFQALLSNFFSPLPTCRCYKSKCFLYPVVSRAAVDMDTDSISDGML